MQPAISQVHPPKNEDVFGISMNFHTQNLRTHPLKKKKRCQINIHQAKFVESSPCFGMQWIDLDTSQTIIPSMEISAKTASRLCFS